MKANGQFFDLNAQRRNNVVEMPASSYRPSPPSTRQRAVSEPDRQLIEKPPSSPPPAREETLRSAPEPPKEPADVPKKKVRSPRASGEQREIAIARVKALVKAGETRKKALVRVAKELGYSAGALNKWMVDAGATREATAIEASAPANGRGKRGKVEAPTMLPIDVTLDLLELAARARDVLGVPSRQRLLRELEKRLA